MVGVNFAVYYIRSKYSHNQFDMVIICYVRT